MTNSPALYDYLSEASAAINQNYRASGRGNQTIPIGRVDRPSRYPIASDSSPGKFRDNLVPLPDSIGPKHDSGNPPAVCLQIKILSLRIGGGRLFADT